LVGGTTVNFAAFHTVLKGIIEIATLDKKSPPPPMFCMTPPPPLIQDRRAAAAAAAADRISA
jgi:hypothetical protein